MKRLISSFAALLAVACLVSACGQKGPLYLPEDGKDGKGSASAHQHKHAEAAQQQDDADQEQPEQ